MRWQADAVHPQASKRAGSAGLSLRLLCSNAFGMQQAEAPRDIGKVVNLNRDFPFLRGYKH